MKFEVGSSYSFTISGLICIPDKGDHYVLLHESGRKMLLKADKGALAKATFENNRNYLCSDSETLLLLKKGAVVAKTVQVHDLEHPVQQCGFQSHMQSPLGSCLFDSAHNPSCPLLGVRAKNMQKTFDLGGIRAIFRLC